MCIFFCIYSVNIKLFQFYIEYFFKFYNLHGAITVTLSESVSSQNLSLLLLSLVMSLNLKIKLLLFVLFMNEYL